MDLHERDINSLRSLQTALKRWISMTLSDPANVALGIEPTLNAQLLDLRRVRWYSLSAQDVEQLWTQYVQPEEADQAVREQLTDFYLNGATFIWLETPIPSGHRDALIDHLATTLTWVSRGTLIPNHVKQYATPSSALHEMLKTNHWILFMILLTMTELD